MGSGASSEKEVSQSNGQAGQVDDVDNYDELYTNQVEVEEKEVELSAFPSLQSSRYWQKKHLVDPELDPETLKWKPTPHNVDLRSVKALQEKEVNTEVEEELLTSSIEALVQKLVENSESESEKVLIFYRWIQHAIDTAIPPSASEQHAAYYLNKIQKQPYMALDLFVKMAEVCEIHCEIIQGYAKGASFAKRLGEQIRLNEPNHHWLAVNMNTYWYLIDLVWCIQQKTDFYFLCEPAVFVYNHFPKESKWQLLYRTLTKSEFTQLAFVHKAFYYHELECLSHPMCVINTSSGEEIIRIGYKEERIWSFRIIAEKNGAIIRNIGGVTIEKCVLVEAYDGVARFNMRFPSVAKYRLDIFCQDPDYTATEPSLVVTYIIQASKSLPNFINFPALDTTIWGATPIPAKLGLIPKSHTRGRIPVEESVQITFSSEKERFLVCHLDSEQDTDFDLEQCVIDSYKSEDKEVSVNVLLPATGFYKLVICLEPEKQGSIPVYVMTYLLECSKPFSQKLVFQNYGDKLGVQSMKKILLEATRTKNLHKLRAAVAVMNANQLHEKVSTEAELAIDMLSKMEQIDEMKQAIEQTDRGTMSEMRNYSKPPKAVHDVLIAALLLLGDSEDSTKLWTDVQSRCGNIGRWSLSRRVRSFNIVYVHHEIAARSQEILERHDINELKSISPGAALFYSWSMNICSEVLNRVESPAKPASVKRQKEIFNMIAKGTWPNIDESGAPVVTV